MKIIWVKTGKREYSSECGRFTATNIGKSYGKPDWVMRDTLQPVEERFLPHYDTLRDVQRIAEQIVGNLLRRKDS